jgi:hypothetical protein
MILPELWYWRILKLQWLIDVNVIFFYSVWLDCINLENLVGLTVVSRLWMDVMLKLVVVLENDVHGSCRWRCAWSCLVNDGRGINLLNDSAVLFHFVRLVFTLWEPVLIGWESLHVFSFLLVSANEKSIVRLWKEYLEGCVTTDEKILFNIFLDSKRRIITVDCELVDSRWRLQAVDTERLRRFVPRLGTFASSFTEERNVNLRYRWKNELLFLSISDHCLNNWKVFGSFEWNARIVRTCYLE